MRASVATLALVLAGAAITPPQAQRAVTPAPPADALVTAALGRARAEGKRVFVDFGASWCAPCRQFEALFSAPATREIWSRHFVLLRLTVWEHGNEVLNNAGAEGLMEKWGGGDSIPHYAVLDPSGAVLASGSGYPSGTTDIAPFVALVARTAPGLAAVDRTALAQYLVASSNGLGSITGRVIDDRGRALAGLVISVVRRTYSNGAWAPAMGARATTDSSGRYIIDGVSAGTYWLVADPVVARAAMPTPAFPPTLYPSARGLSQARTVTVARGQGITSIDVTVAPAIPVAVTGVVRSSTGVAVAGASLIMTNLDWPLGISTTTSGAEGTFAFRAVWPGRYQLWTRLEAVGPAADKRPETSLTTLDVSTASSQTLNIMTTAGATLAGSVRFEGAPALTAAERGGIRIRAVPVRAPIGVPAVSPESSVRADGRFELTALTGARVVRVAGLPQGWMLKSVENRGVDVTDAGFDASAASSAGGLAVVVTSRAGSLSGTVLDTNGRPMASGTVIVFSADRSHWSYPSRFLRTTPVQAGRFTVGALPPDTYLVVAARAATSDWDAPETLERLRPRATSVLLGLDERRTVTLRMANQD